jgi:acetyl esterase/lipase
MTFVNALAILMVRYSIRMMVLTKFQPVPPRENGLREGTGVLGATLAILNMSGPGSRVAHPRLAVEAAKRVAQQGKHKRRHDRVWFDPPSLPYYRGLLTLKTTDANQPGQRVQGCASYNGPAMIDASWAKHRTRAFWFLPRGQQQTSPERQPGGQKEPVILYFHGGAAVTFSAGDAFMGETLASNLARSSNIPVFSVDYNLAPFAPFPVPLVQALGAYLHLTDTLGYKPEQIFIGGDSFGAHLTIQLERYLRVEMPAIRGDVEKQGAVAPGLLLLSVS